MVALVLGPFCLSSCQGLQVQREGNRPRRLGLASWGLHTRLDTLRAIMIIIPYGLEDIFGLSSLRDSLPWLDTRNPWLTPVYIVF